MTIKSELIEQTAESLLHDENYYEAHATPLKSAQAMREQEKLEIMEYLEEGELQKRLKEALGILNERDNLNFLTPEEVGEIETNIRKVNQDEETSRMHIQTQQAKDPNKLLTFQEIFNITNNSLELIYRVGLFFLKEKREDEHALNLFTLLVTLNPTVANFSCALGLCYQQKQKFEEALAYYTLATFLDKNHLGAHISAIECCTKLREGSRAADHWEELARISSESPEKLQPWEEIAKFQKQFK